MTQYEDYVGRLRRELGAEFLVRALSDAGKIWSARVTRVTDGKEKCIFAVDPAANYSAPWATDAAIQIRIAFEHVGAPHG
jgi:hypothetical protein